MSQRVNFSVVFGLGHSHCGSTLLGRMLDMHPDVHCTGELLWLDDALAKHLPCSCGADVLSCPFWSKRLPDLPPSIRGDYLRTPLSAFETLREREGGKLILDLSKSRVYRHKALWKGKDNGYLFIVRDPRALIASRLREGGELEHELNRHHKWERRFERLTRRMGERAMTLYYEDLVARPEPTVRSVCAFLGIDYVPELLTPANQEHHFLHSSVSPYLKGSNTFRVDERWRNELAPGQAERISRKLRGFTLYRDRYGLV